MLASDEQEISFNVFVNLFRQGFINEYVYSVRYENFDLKEIEFGDYERSWDI